MANDLVSMAIAAEFISDSDIKRLKKLLEDKHCTDLVLFLSSFPEMTNSTEESKVKVSLFPANNARERSLEKLKTAILKKRNSGEAIQDFSEEEILKIFGSADTAHFDLIVLASVDKESLSNNFITDASYAEIYIAKNTYNEKFFDINEIETAIQIYENSQRNFGS